MLTALLLFAQIVLNPPTDNASTFSVDVQLVNVLCTVRDGKGGFVRGLSREDFELRDAGRPQRIEVFARDVDTPISIALMVDVSGSVTSVIPAEKDAAARFFKTVLRPGDRAMVGGFAGAIAIWQDITPSVSVLLDALQRIGAGELPPTQSHGGTRLFDAVKLVADQKLTRVGGRKAIIVISDGMDLGSSAKLEEAKQAAQLADSVVYAIHYNPEDFDATPGIESLRRVAEPTGGRVFPVRRGVDLNAIFDQIQEEMRSQYSLGFRPPEGEAGKFRKLHVRVRQPGVKVHARDGYYLAGR